jgi:DNA modification methylase
MYPEDLLYLSLNTLHDQICFWNKPPSPRNTTKKYTRITEAILVQHGNYFNQDLHWSTRTNVFNDTPEKHAHPFRKPFSLVEKLVLLHTPPGGTVLDPFCGSQVVREVCDKHGFKSLSIDEKDWVGPKSMTWYKVLGAED